MPTKSPDGKWRVDIRPEGIRGKRIRRSFDTQAEARRFEAFTTGQAAQGLPWNPSPADQRRFSELIQIWYDSHGKFLKEGTRRLAVLNHVCSDMGDPIGSAMTAQNFTLYRQKKVVAGVGGKQKPPHPKTMNNYLGYCNAVFNELARTEVISYPNPFAKIRPIKYSERELTYLSASQVRTLLDHAQRSSNSDLLLACRLCLSTGCRWGEMKALTIDRVKHGAVTFTETKGKRNRTIPISAELERDLQAHADKDRHLVFRPCLKAFEKMVMGLPFTLPRGQNTHVLRHTFASHFIQKGGDILTLQKILGHTTIAMTMRYAHLAPGHLNQALQFNPLNSQNVDSSIEREPVTV